MPPRVASMLHQLFYSSVATRDFSQGDLVELLDRARDFNDRHRVTGALLYFSETREFFQILEGEQTIVQDLMRRIVDDPRHRGVQVAMEGPLEVRAFVDWSMGFHLVSPQESRRHLGYAPTVQEGLSAAHLTGRPSLSMRLLDLARSSLQAAA